MILSGGRHRREGIINVLFEQLDLSCNLHPIAFDRIVEHAGLLVCLKVGSALENPDVLVNKFFHRPKTSYREQFQLVPRESDRILYQ